MRYVNLITQTLLIFAAITAMILGRADVTSNVMLGSAQLLLGLYQMVSAVKDVVNRTIFWKLSYRLLLVGIGYIFSVMVLLISQDKISHIALLFGLMIPAWILGLSYYI